VSLGQDNKVAARKERLAASASVEKRLSRPMEKRTGQSNIHLGSGGLGMGPGALYPIAEEGLIFHEISLVAVVHASQTKSAGKRGHHTAWTRTV
jgi:hypothetical protein